MDPIDLTADDDAPQRDAAALQLDVSTLQAFTGCSPATARQLLTVHRTVQSAADAFLSNDAPATHDLAAIRGLRAEQNKADANAPRREAAPAPAPQRALAAPGSIMEQLAAVRKLKAAEFGDAKPTANEAPTAVKALTYNVWFEYPETFPDRMAAISRIIDEAGAAVVALQELTHETDGLLAAALSRAGFGTLARQETNAPYFCGLATRKPLGALCGIRTEPYAATLMGRGLLIGRAHWAGVGDVVFGSTHLESFVGRDQQPEVLRNRNAQLAQATQLLSAEAQRHGCVAAVLMGDFNWKEADDGDALKAAGEGWTDAWVDCGKRKDSEHTYNGVENLMLGNRYKSRFDRVLVLARATPARSLGAADEGGKRVTAAALQLVGKKQIEKKTVVKRLATGAQLTKPLLPSDHFGVVVSLELQGPRAAGAAPKSATKGGLASIFAPKPAAKRTAAAAFPPAPPAGGSKPRGGAVLFRDVEVPEGWVLHGTSLLAKYFGDAAAAGNVALAAFDFDETLCPRDFGETGTAAWAHRFKHIPTVLQKLHSDGFAFAVLTNESLDRFKDPAVVKRKIAEKCGRLEHWATDKTRGLGLPVLVCVALSKKDDGLFHKSRGAGMWTHAAKALGVSADDPRAFFVGDSADDRNMAAAAKTTFHYYTDFWNTVHPP
ncbi:Endonuclease/exonuclease/phosphatase [Pelagophyceae sp. CCMP2097]|nr:Endonuclease/exonuclease/phosphatase [Pelagophyceae sp. CCMP2097]